MAKLPYLFTVAILAQGTSWAVAATQAFLFMRTPRESDDQVGAQLPIVSWSPSFRFVGAQKMLGGSVKLL